MTYLVTPVQRLIRLSHLAEHEIFFEKLFFLTPEVFITYFMFPNNFQKTEILQIKGSLSRMNVETSIYVTTIRY